MFQQKRQPSAVFSTLRIRSDVMTKTLCMMAGAAILLAGTSGLALAQYQTYSYQPGYAPGYAQPAPAYGYAQPGYAAAPGCGAWGQPACTPSNAAAGALVGGATGAAIGAATGAAVGAAAGSTQPAYGTTYAPAYGSSYPPPAAACPPGYVMYSTGCYPPR